MPKARGDRSKAALDRRDKEKKEKLAAKVAKPPTWETVLPGLDEIWDRQMERMGLEKMAKDAGRPDLKFTAAALRAAVQEAEKDVFTFTPEKQQRKEKKKK